MVYQHDEKVFERAVSRLINNSDIWYTRSLARFLKSRPVCILRVFYLIYYSIWQISKVSCYINTWTPVHFRPPKLTDCVGKLKYVNSSVNDRIFLRIFEVSRCYLCSVKKLCRFVLINQDNNFFLKIIFPSVITPLIFCFIFFIWLINMYNGCPPGQTISKHVNMSSNIWVNTILIILFGYCCTSYYLFFMHRSMNSHFSSFEIFFKALALFSSWQRITWKTKNIKLIKK